MMLRIGCCALLVLMAATPAWAQTSPLRPTGPSDGAAVGPDQPVQPQVPKLVPRAVQQPAAQPPAPPPPPSPPFTLTPQEEAEVDRVLNLWEERNHSVKTFDCQFKRWTYDVVFGPPNQPKFADLGVIKYATPDRGLFRLDSTEKDGKKVPIEDNRAEHWVSDGKSIFIYTPDKKQLIEQQLPPALQGKAIADGPLPFVFGAEAKRLKQRYWIRLITPPDEKNQIWLEAFPRHQQDAANFHHAQFIIMTEKMEPYALNIIQPNGKDRTTYRFFDIVVNDLFRPFKGDPFRAFTPLGWQRIVQPAQPATQANRPARADRR